MSVVRVKTDTVDGGRQPLVENWKLPILATCFLELLAVVDHSPGHKPDQGRLDVVTRFDITDQFHHSTVRPSGEDPRLANEDTSRCGVGMGCGGLRMGLGLGGDGIGVG